MIYCSSDWHIDNGRNLFSRSYRTAMDWLDFIEGQRLYLLGDTLELWACEWNEIYSGPYQDLLMRLAERKRTTVFLGNHDIEKPILQKFFPKAEIRIRQRIGDRQIFHGFQADPLLDTEVERWVASKFARAFTLVDIPWLNAIRDKISQSERRNEPLIETLQEQRNGFRFLLGHSHVATELGWYTNCGAPGEYFPYVELSENGDAALKYFS